MDFRIYKAIVKYDDEILIQIAIDIFSYNNFGDLRVYNYSDNMRISRLIGINVNEYEEMMKEKFNGYQLENSFRDKITCFKDEGSFNKAKEWVESVIMMKELIGK